MLSYTSCSDRGYFFEADAEEIVVHTGAPGVAMVNGGVPPYRWSITGTAFMFYAYNTNTGDNRVYVTGSYVPGESVEEITVTDRCGSEVTIQVVGCIREVCCDRADYAEPVVAIGDYEVGDVNVPFTVTGGCPPFRWTVFNSDIGLLNRYTMVRYNSAYRAEGFLIDPVVYVVDECGNATGNVSEYSYYFPFQGTVDELVGIGTLVTGNTPTSYATYAEFDTVTTTYSLMRCDDNDLFYIDGLGHIHTEFYVNSIHTTLVNFFTIVYQGTATPRFSVIARYDPDNPATEYMGFSFSSSAGSENVYATCSWSLNTWVSLDITRDADGYTNVYVNGVKLATSTNTYVWPAVSNYLYIGARSGSGSPVQVFKLRLRNCFFSKGSIKL